MSDIFDKNLLKGKKILITGASSGIGFKTSIELSKIGADLIIVGRSNDRLNNLKSILAQDSKLLIIKADLEKKDSGIEILKSLPSDWLPLDGIFHSAGSILIKPYALYEEQDFEKLSAISLKTLLSFSKLFHKKKYFNDYSSIVVMSSVASKFGTQGLGIYSAIKGGINSSCKTMAIEFAKRKIRINAILAGAIKTNMHDTITKKLSEQSIKEYENKHPLGFGELDDISSMICFLMSNASKWITGSLIQIDGGYSSYK